MVVEAFSSEKAFFITLNIVVVNTTYIYIPSKSPFEKGDLVLWPLTIDNVIVRNEVTWQSNTYYRHCEGFSPWQSL